MQKLRKKFPLLNQYLYANTAATGLLSEDLMEWRQGHDLDFLIGGSIMKMKGFEHMPEIRGTVGRFFNCRSENVALVPNILLEGLDKTQNVLLLQDDYPSVNWPFETRNFEVDHVLINERLEENILEKVKTGKFDVLALSLVQWVNGIAIDLDFLKQLKEDFPNLLIIADGTQFCGTKRFNFQDSGIDILGASGYKWLLAGNGNGFILVKDDVKDRFKLKFIGNNSADRDETKRDSIPFCKHLEPGHLDSLNFGSLQFALDFLEDIGITHIEAHLAKLSHKAKTAFSSMGLLEGSVVERRLHSTIFNIMGDQKLYRKLMENDVVCARRGKGIRLSFHFYNTEDEIDAIVKILGSN